MKHSRGLETTKKQTCASYLGLHTFDKSFVLKKANTQAKVAHNESVVRGRGHSEGIFPRRGRNTIARATKEGLISQKWL